MVKIYVTAAASMLFEKSFLNFVIKHTLRVFNLPLIYAGNKVPSMQMFKSLKQQLHIWRIVDVNCGDIY